MRLRKWLLGVLCLAVLLGMLAGPVQATQEVYDEATVLDEMAWHWLDTCKKNVEACKLALDLYALGQPTEWYKDSIKKQYTEDILNGYQSKSFIQCDVDVDMFCQALGSDSLKNEIAVFMTTNPESDDPDERRAHAAAQSAIHTIVKKGQIAEDVNLMDAIKENYAFFIGLIMCETAQDSFLDALSSTELATKREHMLLGVYVATIGCGMSVEDADAVWKNKDKTPEEIMVEVAEAGMDLVSDIAPQIGITYETIKITADIGLKVLSISGTLDALAGYISATETIEEDFCAYYNALSNQYGLYTYEIEEYQVIMDDYNGYLVRGEEYSKVNVPEALYTFPVTGFSGCFAKGLEITEITIPHTIESRGLNHVVDDCDQLEKVYYNALSCPGDYLGSFFYECDSDFQVIFGEGVTQIPERFIINCGLTAITFPEGVTRMNGGAVVSCQQLKTVTLPSTVTEYAIDYGLPAIVSKCQNLETVYYNTIDAKGGYYNAILGHCGNSAQEMTLVFGEGVQTIPATFLSDCGVKQVNFPEGVWLIRDYAIDECTRLETITIPSTVEQFSDNYVCDFVFSDCESLETVYYNAKNASCHLVNVFYEIPSDFQMVFGPEVTEIPECFLVKCGLSAIAFPEGVVTFNEKCLVNCDALTQVTIPSTAKTAAYDLVADCDNVQTVYFNACALEATGTLLSSCGNTAQGGMEVILGDTVTAVPEKFIGNCGIMAFTYPESVRTIHTKSLVNCDMLKTVTIPAGATTLGYEIVSGCEALTDLYFYPDNVQPLSAERYLFRESGNTYGMRLHLDAGRTSLPEYFLYKCGVQSLTFPQGITQIPENTFSYCTKLTEVTLGSNITKVGARSFQGCSALQALEIGSNLAEIGTQAFYRCSALTEIYIPFSVKTIGASAFYDCTGLTTVTYCGTPIEWCAIKLSSGNSKLTNAQRNHHGWDQSAPASNRTCPICGAKETNYWVLSVDSEISWSMNGDLYIDLNGNDLSGTLITNGYKIYGMDSVTDGYTAKGVGKFSCVDENGNAVTPEKVVASSVSGTFKRYLTLSAISGYTFHRYYLGITHQSLKPGTTGLGYKAVFYADDQVKAQLDETEAFGFTLQLGEYMPYCAYQNRKSFTSGKVLTLRINGFDVQNHGQTPLRASVMFKLTDGTVIQSPVQSMTMRSMLETLNHTPLTDAQLAAVRAMVEKYPIIRSWDTENLYA